MRECASLRRSRHHQSRFFDERLEGLQQLRAQSAVNGAVIDGERAGHLDADFNFVADYDRAFLAGAYSEYRRMRWIDHGGEILNSKHAEIGDRGGAALIFLRRETALPGAASQILHFERNG